MFDKDKNKKKANESVSRMLENQKKQAETNEKKRIAEEQGCLFVSGVLLGGVAIFLIKAGIVLFSFFLLVLSYLCLKMFWKQWKKNRRKIG